jgi:hypothetical protein
MSAAALVSTSTTSTTSTNKQTQAATTQAATTQAATHANSSIAKVIACPNFEEPLDINLLSAEMDIDLKTSKSLSGKQYILAIPITQFFRNVRNMYALVNILNGQSIISLRLIEYFVVNYVLENNTFFDINRYNKCPEFLIKNLREKVYSIPTTETTDATNTNMISTAFGNLGPSIVMDKHSNQPAHDLSAAIIAQQQAYKKARDEIIADIKAKSAPGNAIASGNKSRAATSGTVSTRPVKKQPITLETFFSQRAITDHTAAQRLQQQQQHMLPLTSKLAAEKNFDNYIIVHDNYKCQLKEYNKKNFDPFCRWNRIRMYYDKNKFFYTTIAQLNFFKWAIEKHILDYVIENLETIERSMNEYEKSVKAEKQLRKTRQLLDRAGAKTDSTGQPNGEVSNNSQPGQEQELAREHEQVEPGSEDTNEAHEQIGDGITNGTMSKNNELLPISLLSTRKTVKKNIVLGNTENKSLVNIRRKKEFTKTNRSILVFSAYKVVKFD